MTAELDKYDDNESFSAFDFSHGLLYDNTDNQFPTNLYGFTGNFGDLHGSYKKEHSTYYGYVYEGVANIVTRHGAFSLKAGMYFRAPGEITICGGKGIIMERIGHAGTFTMGGPVEGWGRLRYIDGCTDRLLISPDKIGDPCLNALFFPAGIDQTQHTHPSMRVGMVIRGKGECVTPNENIPLFPGQIFIIHEEGIHSFRTPYEEEMVVIAYHPDSDHGPEDEDHPMINRTMVDGKSASELKDIHT